MAKKQCDWSDKEKHLWWQWEHSDPQAVATARAALMNKRENAYRKRSALHWGTLSDVPSGFRVQWHQPATGLVVQRFFWGLLVAEGSRYTEEALQGWTIRPCPAPEEGNTTQGGAEGEPKGSISASSAGVCEKKLPGSTDLVLGQRGCEVPPIFPTFPCMKIANAQAYAFPGTYTFGDLIGGGTYGKVFKAEVNPGRIPVAVKFLRGRHGRETALEEAMALERAQGCRQVLPLWDAWYNTEAKKTALVFPLMSGDWRACCAGQMVSRRPWVERSWSKP